MLIFLKVPNGEAKCTEGKLNKYVDMERQIIRVSKDTIHIKTERKGNFRDQHKANSEG